MTKTVQQAIEALKNLPEDRQETVARAILDYASHDDGVYHLTDEEREEVRDGLAEVKRRDFATDDEVSGLYRRIGLCWWFTRDAPSRNSRFFTNTWRNVMRGQLTACARVLARQSPALSICHSLAS